MSSGEFINHNWGTPVYFEDDEQDYSAAEFHEENSLRNHYTSVRSTHIEQTLADRATTRAVLQRASDELVDETVQTPWDNQRSKVEADDV